MLEFTTTSLIEILPNDGVSTVTAVNGSQYLTSNYYGQPQSGLNWGEPYAYLHFVTTGSVTFDRIVVNQGTPTTAIFENDNHSIRVTTPEIPDTLVQVPVEVPEPSAALLTFTAAAGALLRGRRPVGA